MLDMTNVIKILEQCNDESYKIVKPGKKLYENWQFYFYPMTEVIVVEISSHDEHINSAEFCCEIKDEQLMTKWAKFVESVNNCTALQ